MSEIKHTNSLKILESLNYVLEHYGNWKDSEVLAETLYMNVSKIKSRDAYYKDLTKVDELVSIAKNLELHIKVLENEELPNSLSIYSFDTTLKIVKLIDLLSKTIKNINLMTEQMYKKFTPLILVIGSDTVEKCHKLIDANDDEYIIFENYNQKRIITNKFTYTISNDITSLSYYDSSRYSVIWISEELKDSVSNLNDLENVFVY